MISFSTEGSINENKKTCSRNDGGIMFYDTHAIDMDEEFKVCPTCGYRDGFHTMLKRIEEELKVLFICPGCHDVFDLNLKFYQ